MATRETVTESAMTESIARAPVVPLWRRESWLTMAKQVWLENPIFRQLLGICSTLAVTNLMLNTVVMCAALIFVNTCSCFLVSLLRNITPRRIRMITQMLIIATFVVIVDQVLKAFMWDVSKQLGPYVGLIITNCIIMGRCEAFASQNPPKLAFWDGLGSAFGYSLVLIVVALLREPLGFGTLFGFRIFAKGFIPWQIMVMPPGAFIALGVFIWVARSISPAMDESIATGEYSKGEGGR